MCLTSMTIYANPLPPSAMLGANNFYVQTTELPRVDMADSFCLSQAPKALSSENSKRSFDHPLLSSHAMQGPAPQPVEKGEPVALGLSDDLKALALLAAYSNVSRCRPHTPAEKKARDGVLKTHISFKRLGMIDYRELSDQVKHDIAMAFHVAYFTGINVVHANFLEAFRPEQRLEMILSFEHYYTQECVLAAIVLSMNTVDELIEYFGLGPQKGEASSCGDDVVNKLRALAASFPLNKETNNRDLFDAISKILRGSELQGSGRQLNVVADQYQDGQALVEKGEPVALESADEQKALELFTAYRNVCRDMRVLLKRKAQKVVCKIHEKIQRGGLIDYRQLSEQVKHDIAMAFHEAYFSGYKVIHVNFLEAFRPEQRLEMILSFENRHTQESVLAAIVLSMNTVDELIEYFGLEPQKGDANSREDDVANELRALTKNRPLDSKTNKDELFDAICKILLGPAS